MLRKNMPRIALLAAPLLALWASCVNKDAYTINGKVSDSLLKNQTIYIIDPLAEGPLDSTKAAADGSFTFQGTSEQPQIVNLVVMRESTPQGITLVLEPGNISVNLDDNTIGGTTLNDRLNAYLHDLEESKAHKEMMKVVEQLSATDYEQAQTALMPTYDSLKMAYLNHFIDATAKLFGDNSDNVLGAYAFNRLAEGTEMGWKEADSLLNTASPVVVQYEPNVKLMERLHNIEKTSVGHHYVDLRGHLYSKDSKNGFVATDASHLKEVIDGKVAIIDFWASWCMPCRREIKETLLPLYKKYKGKGLVVVGVSVDEDAEAMATAYQTMNIDYPAMLAEGHPSETYGFNSIPLIILVDANGTIIGRDLRGLELEAAVEAAMATRRQR